MLSEYVINKLVTLHCKEESGLGEVKGIVTKVEIDEEGRSYLILPASEGTHLIVYTDQVAFFTVHGTIEEVGERLKQNELPEEDELPEEKEVLSGSIEEVVEAIEERELEDLALEDLAEDPAKDKKIPRGRLDMNSPDILNTLQGQSGGYASSFNLSKLKLKDKENESNENSEAAPSSEEGRTED